MLWRTRKNDETSRTVSDIVTTTALAPEANFASAHTASLSQLFSTDARRPQVSRAPITSPIEQWLKELHGKYQGAFDGKLADYIPELTRANPALEPELYQHILFALGRLLSDRLRRVTAEVRALS